LSISYLYIYNDYFYRQRNEKNIKRANKIVQKNKNNIILPREEHDFSHSYTFLLFYQTIMSFRFLFFLFLCSIKQSTTIIYSSFLSWNG